MDSDTLATVLFFSAAILTVLGLGVSLRAVRLEAKMKGLRFPAEETLHKAAQAVSSRFKKPAAQTVHGGIADEINVAEGSTVWKGAASGSSATERIDILEGNVKTLREMVQKNQAEAQDRLHAARDEITRRVDDLDGRVVETEMHAKAVDLRALNLQLWGLVLIGMGALLQVLGLLIQP